jgi:hypothetical protein
MTRGCFKTLYDGLPRPSNLENLEKRRPGKAPWKAIVRQDIVFEMRSKHEFGNPSAAPPFSRRPSLVTSRQSFIHRSPFVIH